MKPGPVLAMIGLIVAGMWLVLQPSLHQGRYDFAMRVGAVELLAERVDNGWRFVEPASLADMGTLDDRAFMAEVEGQIESWESRPAVERTLLGFFNITDWGNFAWVALGLAGQIAFFGRMLVQWITSERRGESVVPELFWWLSLMGGVCLFTYFVWRVDFVGVLGQSTGVVVYARNLRLIYKKKRRAASGGDPSPGGSTQKGTGDARIA